jgi:transposase
MRRRHELTDEQWSKIEDELPGKATDPGRTAADNRLFVNAVRYVLNTGIPWADLPERFGKPNTVWKRYDRWAATGVWERVGQALGDADLAEPPEELQLDSTSVKAHPTASTGRRLPAEKNKTPINAGASADPAAD